MLNTIEEVKEFYYKEIQKINRCGIKTEVDKGNSQVTYMYSGDMCIGYIIIKTNYGYTNKNCVFGYTDTRVCMKDEIIFCKKGATHNVTYISKYRKAFDLDDEKSKNKFYEWIEFVHKCLKTAEIKKRKMELDVDFE